jgi:predicted permease
MRSALEIIASSFISMTGLVTISLAGAYLTYKGILTVHSNKALSVAFSHVFWPLFMFWNIAEILNRINSVESIWPLLLNPLVGVVVGTPFILLYARLCAPPSSLRATMLTSVMFTTGGIFTVIVGKDACDVGGSLETSSNCEWLDGYNMLQTAVYGIIFWTAAPLLIKREAEEVKVFNATGSLAESRATRQNHTLSFYILRALRGPVPLASLLAVCFSLIPGVKSLFFLPNSPLSSIYHVCKEMGYYGLLASQMGFGSSLVLMSKHTKLSQTSYIYSAVLFRNVLLSLTGLGIVMLAMHLGVMGDNRVMAFVVLMNWITPPPIGCLFIAQEADHAVDELALLLAVSFPLSIFTMSGCLYVFFTFS